MKVKSSVEAIELQRRGSGGGKKRKVAQEGVSWHVHKRPGNHLEMH